MGMQKSRRRDSRSPDLSELTISLFSSLLYITTICWLIPVSPLVIAWILDWSFPNFVSAWFGGTPVFCLILYYCLRKS